jgi:hypothetical protein
VKYATEINKGTTTARIFSTLQIINIIIFNLNSLFFSYQEGWQQK